MLENPKTCLTAQLDFDLCNPGIAEIHNLTTVFTDEVIMLGTRGDHFILPDGIPEDQRTEDSQALQHLQRIVYGGAPHTNPFVSHGSIQFICGEMGTGKIENFLKNLFSLVREVVSCFPKPLQDFSEELFPGFCPEVTYPKTNLSCVLLLLLMLLLVLL